MAHRLYFSRILHSRLVNVTKYINNLFEICLIFVVPNRVIQNDLLCRAEVSGRTVFCGTPHTFYAYLHWTKERKKYKGESRTWGENFEVLTMFSMFLCVWHFAFRLCSRFFPPLFPVYHRWIFILFGWCRHFPSPFMRTFRDDFSFWWMISSIFHCLEVVFLYTVQCSLLFVKFEWLHTSYSLCTLLTLMVFYFVLLPICFSLQL